MAVLKYRLNVAEGFWGRLSWSFFDFANSAFTTVILTFVFATYFQQAVAPSPELGTRYWLWALSLSGLAIAILSPILGAIADHSGRRKPWIAFFTVICVIATFGLWWVVPSSVAGDATSTMILIALVLVIVANLGFELGIVFYNAMLPDITSESHIGRWSGFAWGLGYVGGLLTVVFCLYVLVLPEPALFGLDKEKSEEVRAVAPFIAIWFALFSIPLFLLTPDTPRGDVTMGQAVSRGLTSLWQSLKNLPKDKNMFNFLIAHLFYRDGLNAIFQSGGLFAAAVFGMSTAELLQFGLIMNVTSALGAFAFAWADDRFGSRNIIILTIGCLIVTCAILLTVQDKTTFFAIAAVLGIFVGAVQASSRTFVGRIADKDKITETYGLFAFSGKSTSFIGPLMVAEFTILFGHRIGMASLLIFLVIGMLLMFKVQPDKLESRT